ncbi:hypothetical protein ACP70R_016093 [Stipagrostis hirtigluma subsp. patula]
MGEKRERDDEPDERPRKAPRLDLLVDVAAALSIPGAGDAASPEASNLKEEGTEGTSHSKGCNHVPTDSAHMAMVRSSLLSEGAGRCEICRRPFPGGDILVCVGCGRHLCSGVGSIKYPFGHSREHAKQEQHWVAVHSGAPESAFCFKCDCQLEIMGKAEAGGHAFGLTDADHDTLRCLSALAKADPRRRKVSNQRADETGDSELCNHVPTGSAPMEILRSLLLSEHAGKCELCLSPLEGSSILVCLDCGRHFCSGQGSCDLPYGHSRLHAMQEQHWVAVQYSEPESGFCFKCGCVVEMIDEDDEIDPATGLPRKALKAIRDFSNVFGSAYWHGYAIRGIPNRTNTCFINAMVQCLLMLDKLRARMLGPDAPQGLLSLSLRELFELTRVIGGALNPDRLLTALGMHVQKYKDRKMEDSHELLMNLRNSVDKEEKQRKNANNQSGAPTVIDSIFRFEVCQTRSCKLCLSSSVSHFLYYELPLQLPSEGRPAKTAASPQPRESLKWERKKIAIQLFPANEKSKSEKIQTVADSGYSHLPGSELKDVVMEETPEPLEVDSSEVQHICQSKDVVQGPLQAQGDNVSCSELSRGIVVVPIKSVSSLAHYLSDVKVDKVSETEADSIASIEDCLLRYFEEEEVEYNCEKCSEVHEELSTNQSKSDGQTAAISTKNTTVDGEQTDQSDRTTFQNEQSSGSSSSSKSHDQLKDDKKEQKDRKEDSIVRKLITKLPPVLTLHLNRGTGNQSKISGHVRYEEYLDVGPFMDPSSLDEGNSIYHLVGVVEHRGEYLTTGHYVAYVKARRLENHQRQDSLPYLWFCADDSHITEVSVEEVLRREAYVLFYERMED